MQGKSGQYVPMRFKEENVQGSRVYFTKESITGIQYMLKMLAIIITEEKSIARSFINVVFNSTGDRVKVQKGNQLSKLGKNLQVHTCSYLIVQTTSQ